MYVTKHQVSDLARPSAIAPSEHNYISTRQRGGKLLHVWACVCERDGRRRLWMCNKPPWALSAAIGEERVAKKKKRAAQRKRTKEATEAPDKKAIDSWMANAAQLWHCQSLCPNLASSFIGCQCPLLFQGAWHFSAQLANTLACSPIPLQGQWATHSSTHHTQKAFHMQQQQQQQQLGVWWKMQSWCCK